MNSFGKESTMAIDQLEFGKTSFPEVNVTQGILPQNDYGKILAFSFHY